MIAAGAKRVVVAGVARNCGKYLPAVLGNVQALTSIYADAKFVFATSDSIDDTSRRLKDWLAAGREGEVIDLGLLEPGVPERTARIAIARNACLARIREKYADRDHLLVADLDQVLSRPVSLQAFSRAAGWLDDSPERIGIFANSTPRYYDVWALRHPSWCPADCWQSIWGSPREAFEAAKFREVFRRQIFLPPSLPPIRVSSAFGGLGLYKLAPVLGASYRGLDHDGQPVSEHVAFNRSLDAAGGELYIFPQLIVQAPTEHLYDPAEFELPWRLRMLRLKISQRLRPPWKALVAPASSR